MRIPEIKTFYALVFFLQIVKIMSLRYVTEGHESKQILKDHWNVTEGHESKQILKDHWNVMEGHESKQILKDHWNSRYFKKLLSISMVFQDSF